MSKNITFTAMALVCLCAWLCAQEPQQTSGRLESGQTWADKEFTASFDGTAQRYIEILPEGFDPAKRADLIVILHGHGSDRTQVFQQRGECAAPRMIAQKYGAVLISPDYRAKTSWMGPAAEADMLQLLALVKEQYNIGRTVFVGGSMGGSSVLTFTALHPELVDGGVAYNPTANHLEYENFQDAIAESFGGTKQQIPLEYKNRSAEYFPERFTMPIAVTAGGQDDAVPPQSVMRLLGIVEKLQPNTWMRFDPEGVHATGLEDSLDALEFVFSRMP
ncbi:MAG: alpha/beta fold hydrolase [Thermoguttaceae bacterium]|nr:alpha/beta fold hydrolase [Thermoguttaceae bacterium]MBQ6619350.1 alpha/beta fold hydrolase [Thermoguttaceae bacterium]